MPIRKEFWRSGATVAARRIELRFRQCSGRTNKPAPTCSIPVSATDPEDQGSRSLRAYSALLATRCPYGTVSLQEHILVIGGVLSRCFRILREIERSVDEAHFVLCNFDFRVCSA